MQISISADFAILPAFMAAMGAWGAPDSCTTIKFMISQMNIPYPMPVIIQLLRHKLVRVYNQKKKIVKVNAMR